MQDGHWSHKLMGYFCQEALATVLTCLSAKLLEAVLQQAGIKRRSLSLTELLFKEAQNPNKKRDTLPQVLQKM